MNHLQKRRLIIAFLCLWLAIFIIGVYQASNQKANASGYINGERIVIGVNYYPPRVQQICSDAFIGVEYNPKLEKRCRGLWNDWTREILLSASNF